MSDKERVSKLENEAEITEFFEIFDYYPSNNTRFHDLMHHLVKQHKEGVCNKHKVKGCHDHADHKMIGYRKKFLELKKELPAVEKPVEYAPHDDDHSDHDHGHGDHDGHDHSGHSHDNEPHEHSRVEDA